MKGEHHILLPFTTKAPSPEWESTVFAKKNPALTNILSRKYRFKDQREQNNPE